MGRKTAEEIAEEKGEARRLPSNVDIKKFQDRVLQLRDQRRKQNAKVGAQIRDAFDDAENAGVDVETLKLNIKLIEMGITDDKKIESNVYFEKSGQKAFFFLEEADAA